MNDCVNLSVSQVCDFLKEHDKYVIITHASPDGDTLGAGFAFCGILQAIGKKARVICPDEIPTRFGYFTESFAFDDFNEETVVSVDVADDSLLGRLKEAYAGRIELAIDHHISNTRFAKRLLLDVEASAVCESIYEIGEALGVEITLPIARALYTGIATDCGCFKYSNTTARTHEIAAKLIKTGVEFAEINRKMFDTKSRERLEIERMAMDKAEFCFDDRCIIVGVTLDMIKGSGCNEDDLEGLTVISRSVEGIYVAATVREKEPGVFKISIRSFDPINASKICAEFGGGGHSAAAGCTIKGTLEKVIAELKPVIKKALEQI